MLIRANSNQLGVVASSLCLVHCLATPFVFVTKACTMTCCDSSPVWWSLIDSVFLVVSLVSVYWSAQKSSSTAIQAALWSSWLVLMAVIANEYLNLISLSSQIIYFPTITLILLHLLNWRFYHICDEDCATDMTTLNTGKA